MHRTTSNWTWTLNSQKYSIWIKYPRGPILVRSALRLAVSEIQGRQKTEMHRMTPNWTWTLDSQKYPVYMKYLPLRPKCWSVSLYGQRFPTYRTFNHSPLTTMSNGQKKKKKKKNRKIWKNLEFQISLLFNNFVRDPPQEYTWILRSKSGNDPKITWTATRTEWPQNGLEHNPYILYQCPRVPNFKRFCRFLVTDHFETSVLNDPKWPWTQQRQGTPCMLYPYPRVPNFNPFRSAASSLTPLSHQ